MVRSDEASPIDEQASQLGREHAQLNQPSNAVCDEMIILLQRMLGGMVRDYGLQGALQRFQAQAEYLVACYQVAYNQQINRILPATNTNNHPRFFG